MFVWRLGAVGRPAAMQVEHIVDDFLVFLEFVHMEPLELVKSRRNPSSSFYTVFSVNSHITVPFVCTPIGDSVTQAVFIGLHN